MISQKLYPTACHRHKIDLLFQSARDVNDAHSGTHCESNFVHFARSLENNTYWQVAF